MCIRGKLNLNKGEIGVGLCQDYSWLLSNIILPQILNFIIVSTGTDGSTGTAGGGGGGNSTGVG